jgi:hypothetical protein
MYSYIIPTRRARSLHDLYQPSAVFDPTELRANASAVHNIRDEQLSLPPQRLYSWTKQYVKGQGYQTVGLLEGISDDEDELVLPGDVAEGKSGAFSNVKREIKRFISAADDVLDGLLNTH